MARKEKVSKNVKVGKKVEKSVKSVKSSKSSKSIKSNKSDISDLSDKNNLNIEEIDMNFYDNEFDNNEEELIDNLNKQCPYLDTINRSLLDFDFEKLCSVSLTHLNVYACLVCGKYFQGRHKNSHAYIHSVESGHYVWINLETLKFYCLPENYEIIDTTLDDIKRQIKPVFDKNYIKQLDNLNSDNQKIFRCLDGSTYYQGVLSMNNIKETDYMNVILQSLSFVKPLRNYFLIENNYIDILRPSSDILYTLLGRYGELTRKLWNNINFRSHISPHEMIQAVVLASKKRFQLEKQNDPIQFLSWLLNNLHQSINWDGKHQKSIIYKGRIKIFTRKMKVNEIGELTNNEVIKPHETTITTQPFLFIPLEIPPPPLFKDEIEGNVIAQISLLELLEKYNGIKEDITKQYEIKRYSFDKLPQYLIFCLKRFSFNYFFTERNSTIVNFNINGLDMAEFVDPLSLKKMSSNESTIYNLIANIVISQESMLDGADKPAYLLQIYHKGLNKWFEIQDLHIKEVMPQMITISESYIQIWERQ